MSQIKIRRRPFSEVNLDDPFFDSLKNSYNDFSNWFKKKANEPAYVGYNDSGEVKAFVYLKEEKSTVTDVTPPIPAPCLKVGTLKIEAHGTKLGERFIKIIFDELRKANLNLAYVTVFPEHTALIKLFQKYGFVFHGTKGNEDVYVKKIPTKNRGLLLDYPVVQATGAQKWLLAIRPAYHTPLFPDSILRNESLELVQDVPETNSIHKVYIGWMRDFPLLRNGDCIIIYRCQNAYEGPAWYRSVATSLCVLEEIHPKDYFHNETDFIDYCKKHSVFSETELSQAYHNPKPGLHTLKMTYNFAFEKRPNLEKLVNSGAVPHPRLRQYMGLLRLSDEAFSTILRLGGIDESLAVY